MKCLTKEYQASHMENRQLVYDGKKSAFVAGPLPFDSKEFVSTVPEKDGRQREFKVTVIFAAKKDLDHLRMFLNGRHDGVTGVNDRQVNRAQVFEDLLFEMNDQIQLAAEHLKELNLIIQHIRTMKDVADNLYYK